VTFWARGARVESGAVVAELENDVVVGFRDGDPDVGRVGVLHRVHDAFAGDVEDQQGDRGRQGDVFDVVMEADPRVAADLVCEGLERLREADRAQRRTVQLTDQGADAIGRLLLGVLDLLELVAEIIEVSFVEHLAGDVNLERESE